MPTLVGEAHYLVFDRRAVTRTDTFYHACVKRRTIQGRCDDVVRARIRVRDVTRHLARMFIGTAEEGEHRRGLIAPLHGQTGVVDAAPVNAGRRARLQSAY